MQKNLYFTITNDPCDAAGDAVMINAETVLGMKVATSTTVEIYFNKVDGTADFSKFTITHPADGFIVIHDKVSGEGAGPAYVLYNAVGEKTLEQKLITSVALTTL